MRTITCVAIAALLCGAGCRKPQPSPAYTEASGSYTTLLAQHGDDAYAMPEMEHIEQLLASVPANSSDAAAATALKATIAAEHRRVEQEAKERENAQASALAPTASVDFGSRTAEPVAAAADAADAGSGSDIAPGMTLEALRSVTQGCFSSSGPVTLRNPDGTDGPAEMYERLDSTRCNEKYAKYAARILVMKDGKLVGDFPKAALTQMKVSPPAAPAPPPKPPPGAPPPPIEPGGDKPPTPQAPPTTPGENTGPAPQ